MIEPGYWAAILLGGYVCGSVPFGLVFMFLAGHGDVRKTGSGNIGMTNVLRAGHKGLALATLLADSGKAALVCLVVEAWVSREAGLVAGLAALLGHCFPIWLKFRGGKAVAASFGFALAVMWQVGVLLMLIWLVVALISRYSSLAAITSMGLLPLWMFLMQSFLAQEGQAELISSVCLSLLVLSRHKGNIARLLAGTESRIGDKKPASDSDADSLDSGAIP